MVNSVVVFLFDGHDPGSLRRLLSTFPLLLTPSTLLVTIPKGTCTLGKMMELISCYCWGVWVDCQLGGEEKNQIPSRLLQEYKGNPVPLPQICFVKSLGKKIKR